jgi:hypothetical protein
VPELSRFHGIVISMPYRDHAPPHFHATYGDADLAVAIDPLVELAGKLPRRATAMVLDWAAIHQAELIDAWNRARAQQPLPKILPLP